MKYMTEQLMQRFTSNMSTMLNVVQQNRGIDEEEILTYKQLDNDLVGYQRRNLHYWYRQRELDKKMYVKFSSIQAQVKSGFLTKSLLQKMEKVVTNWIVYQADLCEVAYGEYLHNRYDSFYRNRTKQGKKKLAKLVELQQAIRKEKSITRG